MRIITNKPLREFGDVNSHARNSIEDWYKLASSRMVIWNKPQDVVKTFGERNVDILQNNRVCIDIKGNDIRVVLKVEYGRGMAFVKWIGWHKDYERLGKNIHSI
ncbi:MAG: type II toxin-antitoxin system HigB family toxin [Saprospiraceae bacterium]